MLDRKKLLQDFYAKYAPDQELSDERLKAINTKYGEDNDRLLQDFYTKYAPNEQVTPERLDAIYGKYGLKKKQPTQQAGALGAMPSRSVSSGNLQEMLAAAPPLPADARVNVPIGAQPQRPQERAITTALPPIGNIPLRTEEQRTEERQALYEPSQVSKRLSNFAVEMTTVLPAIEQWQRQAGNAMLGRFAGKEANEAERAMMIAQEVNLQDLESKLQDGTEGEIIQSIKKRDIPALAFGIFDASLGILRSGIVGGLTMGAGTIPDMIAQSTRSFNKSKAEALGITPEQLIEQGKEDVAIPTVIGAIGGSLELIGLKGITSAITKKIGTKVGQQIATGLMGTGGEGITEWTQAGLERANESLAKGKSVADATNDAVELMFSEDGLEAALKGMTGAGTTIAAGRGIRALTSAKAKIDAGQPITAQEAQYIAVANIESNGAVAAALENMVNLGAINQQQAQVIGAEMEAMTNAAGKVPNAMAASAPQLAPIILEKQNIDARIAELNVEMATKDESFAPLYKMEIRDLEARKTQLNEQIQAVITPQAESAAVELEMPSIERILEDLDNGKVVTFQYEKESDIPIEFRDKVSSFGEVNGKKNFNVTMAESLANYYLSKQNAQQPTTQQEAATPQAQQQVTEAGEVEVFSQTDNKGRVTKYFSNTTEKDGVTKTTFTFNRSDKDSSQRNNALSGVPVETALGDKYTIDETYLPEGAKIIGVSEIRATDKGAAATVMFEADGQRFQGEVKLVEQPLKETPQTGAVVEGVQEGGVDTRIANSPLAEVVNKRGVITDANGNLVEGDVYVDGERVVLEAGGKIYDTLGSIDELSQMTAEQLPVQVVAPRITATEGGFTYNSDAGAMPQGTRITPQGKGLKAVKRDKNGNVKSVVVKDDAGNTFNLKGEDAQAMAFELMMDEISKGNLDAKIVLNDEAATAINTAGRPATAQAADSGATQADATRQGAAAPTTATERGDGGRGSRVEATQETEAKPKAKPDAAKEPSTEGVDARKQAEDGEGVGKEDSKGKEAAQEGEVADKPKTPKEMLAEVRDRKKAAIDVLKKQWENAKNTGISTNFEQRLKDDKAFFGAIRDIIQSNIEIGALKITDSLNDIADALGIKLSKADKDAVKGVFNKEVLRSLKSAQAEMFETEVVREALGEYIEENKQVLKGAANAQALKLVNEASTEDGFNRALKYIDKLINDTQFREAVDAASNAVSNVKPKLTRLGVSRGVVDFLSGVKVSSLEDVNILSKLAKILKSPADFNIADVTALASEVQNYLEQNAKENVPTQKYVENRIKKLLSGRERNAKGEMQDVPKTFDTPRKIQELAKSIAKAESEIMRLDINDDERAALLEQLKPAMQELSNAQSNLAEAVQAFTEQNIDASKQMVEAIKRGDIVVDEQSQEAMGLIALGKDPSLMDGLSYYESQKLVDGLQEIANGYTPLGFFKSVSAGIINKPQREGIGLLEKQATAQTKANAEAMDKNGGLIGMARMAFDTLRGGKKFAKSAQKARAGKQEKSDIKILAEMVTRGLVQIDTMYNLVKSTPVRKSIILPLVRAYNAYQTDVEQTTNSFRRKAGLSAVAPNTVARIKRNNKVGFVLLQESENANRGKYNMLAETAKYYESMREKEIGVPIEERVAAIELAEQFPNGITKEDLTESELKIYEAFRELMDNNLESKARMSALTAGTPWERLQAYAPYLRADRSSAYGATGTKETESDLMALMEAKGDSPKNPKVMSDRNLQRDPNAAFFAPIANVVTMANIATNEVMKQYHMQPTLFATMRALNGIIGDTNSSVVKALKQAYIGEVSLKMSGYTKPILKGISGFSNTLVGTKLANFNRIAGEVSAGLLQFGKTISLSKMPEFSVLLPNFRVKDKLDGEFGGSLLARGGVKDMRSKVDKGKEIYNRLLSPDEINMSMYRTAAFKYVMMQAFRESTGKALDYGKITDAEYFDANRAELKKAYDKAIAEALPVYDKSGIGRQYAVRFPFSGRAVLNASKSENNRLAFSMAMLFGRYASASGNDTVLSMASAFGTNKDTPLTERVKASTAMKKMLFTIGEGMVYTAAIDIFVASVEAFSSDDEEEKERIWNDLRKSYTDPRKLIAAGMGSMLYFGTGVYGVFGKIMSYTSLAVVKAGYDYLYKDSKEITKSEYDSVVGNLSKTSSDMFYMPLAKSERELEQNILQMAAGGIGFLGKETASVAQSFGQFGEEVMKDAERALNGEELEGLDAMNALYALGIVVNHLGRPIGVQVPFIENARRASRNVESLKESSDPDKIARAEKIDNAKALRLMNNYADITLNEEFAGNPDALEENKSKLEESLQRIGLSEEKVENRLKSFEKKYNEKKYPMFMYNIIKETSPKAAAVRAANAYEELAADMADALNKGNAKKANELEETISAFREMLYDKKMSKIEFEDEFYARLSAKGIEY